MDFPNVFWVVGCDIVRVGVELLSCRVGEGWKVSSFKVRDWLFGLELEISPNLNLEKLCGLQFRRFWKETLCGSRFSLSAYRCGCGLLSALASQTVT